MSKIQVYITCTAVVWTVTAEISISMLKSARHTDLRVVFGEIKEKELCYSSGSSWHKWRSVAAHDAQETQESSGYRNLKTELTEISKVLDTLDISWGHRWGLSSDHGAASGIPKR